MSHIAEAAVLIVFILACVLCLGEPDILDGLIKRANNVPMQCEPEARPQASPPPTATDFGGGIAE